MKNRRAKLLFIKRNVPVRISSRQRIIIYNRSGDVCLYGCSRKSASQNRRRKDRESYNKWRSNSLLFTEM